MFQFTALFIEERIQEISSFSFVSGQEESIPFRQQSSKLVAQCGELRQPFFERRELVRCQRANLAAGGAAGIARRENSRELIKSKTKRDGSANGCYPPCGNGRIISISVRLARWMEQTEPLVMAQRICAYS